MSRVIVLVDMDCFYAQVEQRDQPSLWEKPVGVLQYSANGQSGLIAVSYEARPFGVKRGMTAKQCKELCPEIEICLVPQGEYADKADIQKYRDASAEVFAVLGAVDGRVILERASVDEAFLDLTVYVESRVAGEDREETIKRLLDPSCLPTSFVVDGKEDEDEEGKETDVIDNDESVQEEEREMRKKEREEERKARRRRKRVEEFVEKCRYDDEFLKIALAVEFAERLRERVREKTQFYCSAGVGNNKMMAKLVCAVHKPRKQSFVPPGCARAVLRTTPISSIRGLGGKTGREIMESLGVTTMGEVQSLPPSTLSSAFPAQAEWLMRLARGEDDEAVKPRTTQTSIGVGKNFPGKLAISTVREARHWMEGLTKELGKRLADDKVKNRRMAQNIVVHLTTDVSTSRTVRVGAAEEKEERLLEKLWPVMLSLRKGPGDSIWQPPIFNISLSAGRFLEGLPSKEKSIMGWMERRAKQLEAMQEKNSRTVDVVSVDPAEEERQRQNEVEMKNGESSIYPLDVIDEKEEEGGEENVVVLDDDEMEEQPGPSKSSVVRRPAVVQIDESAFELDDEGWQVWPTPSSSSAVPPTTSTTAAATAASNEGGERGGKEKRGEKNEKKEKEKEMVDEANRERTRRRREIKKKVASMGEGEVDREVLWELPANIRQELMHVENLRAAKEMKEKQAKKDAASGKRKRKTVKEEKEETKRAKPIEDFFGGKRAMGKK